MTKKVYCLDNELLTRNGFRLKVVREPGERLELFLMKKKENSVAFTWLTPYQCTVNMGDRIHSLEFKTIEKIMVGVFKEFYEITAVEEMVGVDGKKWVGLCVKHTDGLLELKFEAIHEPLRFLSKDELSSSSDMTFHAYRVMFWGGDRDDFPHFKKEFRKALFEHVPGVEVVRDKNSVIKRIENLGLEVISNLKVIDSIEFSEVNCLNNEEYKADLVVCFSNGDVGDGKNRANVEEILFKEVRGWGDDVEFMVIDFNARNRHRGKNGDTPYTVKKVTTRTSGEKSPQELLSILLEPLKKIAERRGPLWQKKKKCQKTEEKKPKYFMVHEICTSGSSHYYVPPIGQKIFDGDSMATIKRYHVNGETYDRMDICSSKGIPLIDGCYKDESMGRVVIVKEINSPRTYAF